MDAVTDLLDLINAHDLDEVEVGLAAWWLALPDDGHACGLVVRTVRGKLLYLESLDFDGQLIFEPPKPLRKFPPHPESVLFAPIPGWDVDLSALNPEINSLYCR